MAKFFSLTKNEKRTTRDEIMDYIFCLNSSDENLSMGIGTEQELLFQVSGRTLYHSKFISTYFEKLIEIANFKKDDFSKIILCKGPGSFTGLRVGMAFALGLAESLKIPVYGVDKFSIFSQNFKQHNCNLICVVLLNRDQVIVKGFEIRGKKIRVILRHKRILKKHFVKTIKQIRRKQYVFCGDVQKSGLNELVEKKFRSSSIIDDNLSTIKLSDLISNKKFARKI